MSNYLYWRLSADGSIPLQVLVSSLSRAQYRKTSFVEEIVRHDLGYLELVERCFASEGPAAAPDWRIDAHLLMEVPPGACARLLAFPFRERAGQVEVATVCPRDLLVADELSFHLGRPVLLLRAGVQGLLAAAGAPVDFRSLSLRPAAPIVEDEVLPLVRRATPHSRPRIATSPGLGGDGGQESDDD